MNLKNLAMWVIIVVLTIGLFNMFKNPQNLQNKNKKIVNHMAKQFDMKQSAKRAVHAFNGKTGKLDMNKLAKYQIVDDIFKRVTYLPEGKNHRPIF